MGLHMTGSTVTSLNNAFAGRWQAAHAYLANDVVVAPDGSVIERNAAGTSRSTYDTTEQAAWTVTAGGSGSFVGKASTATSGALGISPNPANQVGAGADNYVVLGGETTFPNRIRNARLAFLRGYDNDIWDNSIASVNDGFHAITGGTVGHETVGGGSLHAVFGGYSGVGAGTANRVLAAKGTIGGGDTNTVGVNVATTLTVATAVGNTAITVADPTGIAVGQIAYLGLGTAGLDAGEGPLERARVASIAGSVITLDTFQAVSTTSSVGVSTGTALTAVHPIGAAAFFSDNTKTGATCAGGYLNTVLGQYATVPGGRENVASGDYSTAAGYGTLAAGTYSRSSGRYSSARTSGQVAHAAGRFAVTGDTQISRLHVFGTTTDGTTAVGLNPSGSGGTMHQLTRGQVVGITASIVGQSSDGTVTAYYVVHHVAQFAAAGNSAWLGSPMTQSVREDTGIGGVSFTAGSSVGSVNIKVTGKAATTMKWTGRVELTEVAV